MKMLKLLKMWFYRLETYGILVFCGLKQIIPGVAMFSSISSAMSMIRKDLSNLVKYIQESPGFLLYVLAYPGAAGLPAGRPYNSII